MLNRLLPVRSGRNIFRLPRERDRDRHHHQGSQHGSPDRTQDGHGDAAARTERATMTEGADAAPTAPDGDDDELTEDVVKKAMARMAVWKRMYTIWIALHYFFSIGAMGATVAAGVLPSRYEFSSHTGLYTTLSIAATLLVFLLAFTSPTKQARMYMTAWRLLDGAVTDTLIGDMDASELASKIKEGEDILSGKDPF